MTFLWSGNTASSRCTTLPPCLSLILSFLPSSIKSTRSSNSSDQLSNLTYASFYTTCCVNMLGVLLFVGEQFGSESPDRSQLESNFSYSNSSPFGDTTPGMLYWVTWLCFVVFKYVMLCHVMVWFFVFCHVIWCHVIQSNAMSEYFQSLIVLPCGWRCVVMMICHTVKCVEIWCDNYWPVIWRIIDRNSIVFALLRVLPYIRHRDDELFSS